VLISQGRVISPRIVYDEISARQDGLLLWADSHPQVFFRPNREMLDLVVQINNKYPLLVNKNKSKLGADPHVVALAVLLQRRSMFETPPVVVTEESNFPSKVTKIPYVAQRYDISCINMADLLRREGIGA